MTTAQLEPLDRLPTPSDWTRVTSELDVDGFAVLPGALSASHCAELTSLYDEPARFRSHVLMARHG